VTGITEHLNGLKSRIFKASSESGRAPESISVLAVSKKHDIHAIAAATEAGLTDFGENYVAEAVEKITRFPEVSDKAVTWHFIGRIQSNKTKEIATHFDWVQTVDRAKIARRLAAQRPAGLPPLQILIQVQVDSESDHGGVTPEHLAELAEMIAGEPQLQLRGLMCIPMPSDSIDEQRKPFHLLKKLFDDLNGAGYSLDTLSMGMSNDLEAAIMEDSTMVRIGTALFGPRQY